jgi:hypothetical protein
MLHAFALGVGVGKLEGVTSEEPVETMSYTKVLRDFRSQLNGKPIRFPTGHQNFCHNGVQS